MLFGSSKKKLVGLDIGSSSIKLAELEISKSGSRLNSFGIWPTPPGAVGQGDILSRTKVADAVRGLLGEVAIKAKSACVGVWGNAVIVKKISIPRMDSNLIAEQIRWEAEQYIPFDISEVNLEYHILQTSNQGGDNIDVLLVAAKRDFIVRFSEAIGGTGLRCAVVDVNSFALSNCFEANYGVFGETVALINVGSNFTNFVIIEKGEPVFCRDIMVGGLNYTTDLHKEMGVSPEEADALKLSAISKQEIPEEVVRIMQGTSESIADEVQHSFEFYAATAGGRKIERMFVSGGSSQVPGLVELISQTAGLKFEIFNPFRKIDYNPRKFTREYVSEISPIAAVVLGLAMRTP